MSGTAPKESTRRTTVMAAAVVVGLIASGGLVLRSTEAVFSANVTNGSNSWNTGSVAISTDLAGVVMFDSAVGKDGKMKPGTVLTKCIQVSYTGDVAANVKLYTSVSAENGTPGLLNDLTFEINEGTGTPAANAACTGFTPGTVIQGGLPTDKLSAFTAKTTYASGVSTWAPTGPATKMYRFMVTMPAASTLQAAGATATFKWEAQSS
ncbi:hypothetical protein [Cellulomonas sp. URHB0016]